MLKYNNKRMDMPGIQRLESEGRRPEKRRETGDMSFVLYNSPASISLSGDASFSQLGNFRFIMSTHEHG